ncbi:MAG: polyribonucleotide nucleotidyltransferase [Candidatus Gygaella obscura]|nr:polyribonucleotide nucleotidyltransferase [Candidatus Gygaella obscura]
MDPLKFQLQFGHEDLIIETGKIAKQANGAVTVTCGGTIVLVTACMSKQPKENLNFFPLTVEYQEKTYAAGRIPGGFFKREGRPTEGEILTARLIDRPIRPLFPKGFRNEVQIMSLVLSSDGKNDPDVLAIVGASTALSISEIPFKGPLGACRVCLLDDKFILNPTYEEREKSELDLVVAGCGNGPIMLESCSKEISEEKYFEAIKFGYEKLHELIKLQLDIVDKCGKNKIEPQLKTIDEGLLNKIKELSLKRLKDIMQLPDKEQREEALDVLDKEIGEKLISEEITSQMIKDSLVELEKQEVRSYILKDQKRIDGRSKKDIRPISGEVGLLPRTHGSGLFTRGQTQSLSVTTLGTGEDEQMIEALEGESYRSFMLHYNFPPFSVGETRPVRGPGRREIGHGALAGKALKAVLPSKEQFPYTVRVVSEILESNGSSSMATVCAATLALMDAGVPIKEPVAGIAIGLVKEGDNHVLLNDLNGLEDHFGDMDFKVAGTKDGITTLQMDLKIDGLEIDMFKEVLQLARESRFLILEKIKAIIPQSRKELSVFAPRIVNLKVNPDKIGEVIGPGGKTIKKIIAQTGVTIDIEDDGNVLVASSEESAMKEAISIIESLTKEVQPGEVYDAVVKKVTNFGAFCEILPGKEGLVHVSELADRYVKDVASEVKVGDKFKVKVIEIDDLGRINLSKKQAEQ